MRSGPLAALLLHKTIELYMSSTIGCPGSITSLPATLRLYSRLTYAAR